MQKKIGALQRVQLAPPKKAKNGGEAVLYGVCAFVTTQLGRRVSTAV